MSELRRRLSFLSYAVNGAGTGHVVRQLAIQRALRRLCALLGVKSEHWFLTTSEADSLVFREGCAAFKLPSKSIVEDAGIDKLTYLATAKQWVWQSLSSLRPDVLIVDTFAEGSFAELPAALDLVKHTALIQRPMNDAFSQRTGYAALVRAYDRVIVPEHEDDEPALRDLLFPDDSDDSALRFVGPIVRPERRQLRSRADARSALGVPDGARCVLVTGGGGGDDTIDALFDTFNSFGSDENVHVVYAAGPLYRGAPRHGPGRTFFVGHDLAEHALAFDVAVTAAGFNTIHELLLFGVPLVVVPQEKIADDQAARAARYAAHGALRVSSLSTVSNDVRALLNDDDARTALSHRAQQVMPRGHAIDAALAILELLVPQSVHLMLRRLLDEGAVAGALDVIPPHMSAAAEANTLRELMALAQLISGHDDKAGLLARDLQRACALVADTGTSGELLMQLADQLRKKFLATDLDRLLRRLLTGPLREQPAGLAEVLKALHSERHIDASRVIEAIELSGERTALRGEDLSQLAARLRLVRTPSPRAISHAGSHNVARLALALEHTP